MLLHHGRVLGQSGPQLDILVVVPRVLQVGVLVCPALFHHVHVQAHTLVAQHFCPFSIFLIFWLFVAKSNVFLFNGIFLILSYLSNLPCCDPEPQTTAKLPPHNVVAQHFGWFCHFCAWARCAGAARRGTRGETAVECAKCVTRQIWGPNQVPCIGRCRAP